MVVKEPVSTGKLRCTLRCWEGAVPSGLRDLKKLLADSLPFTMGDLANKAHFRRRYQRMELIYPNDVDKFELQVGIINLGLGTPIPSLGIYILL